MLALRRKLLVPERYSNRFSSNPFPLNGLQFYADLWHYDQKGYGTLTNGTGIATPTSLSAGANTVTNTQAGTFTIWLPDKHTGTATSGTATVTGSPVSLVGGNNTITVTGTGTITVTCTDQVVDRSINAVLSTVTGATSGWRGRTYDGVANSIISAANTAFEVTASTGFTLGGWVNKTAANQHMLCVGFSNEPTQSQRIEIWVQMDDLTTNNVRVFSSSGGGDNTTAISASAYHLLMVSQAAGATGNNALVYLDGKLHASLPVVVYPTWTTGTIKACIGNNANSLPFKGTFGEAWGYSQGLVAQEHRQIYNATKDLPRYRS